MFQQQQKLKQKMKQEMKLFFSGNKFDLLLEIIQAILLTGLEGKKQKVFTNWVQLL
jgi:hypothetical protein